MKRGLRSEASAHFQPMITVEELAVRWDVDVKTVYKAIQLGQIPAVRVGRKVLRIPRSAVESLEAGQTPPSPRGGNRGSSAR